MSALFKVGTINNISRVGLKRFPQSLYQIGALDEDTPLDSPMALMLRSHKLQNDQKKKISKLSNNAQNTQEI